MACEFIVEAHGFFTHDFFATDYDCIFDRAAFDESFVEEGFDVFVVDEGSGWGDFFFVDFWGDYCGEELGESAIWSYVSD